MGFRFYPEWWLGGDAVCHCQLSLTGGGGSRKRAQGLWGALQPCHPLPLAPCAGGCVSPWGAAGGPWSWGAPRGWWGPPMRGWGSP